MPHEFFDITGKENPAGPSAQGQALFRPSVGKVRQHAVFSRQKQSGEFGRTARSFLKKAVLSRGSRLKFCSFSSAASSCVLHCLFAFLLVNCICALFMMQAARQFPFALSGSCGSLYLLTERIIFSQVTSDVFSVEFSFRLDVQRSCH
jgi:hypothetical protein